MSTVVFLTGATGFLGTWIARLLLDEPATTLVALVRAANPEEAGRRLARAWWDFPGLRREIGARVQVLSGDVGLPCLGLDDASYADLARRVTHVIHAAADLRLDGPLEELRRANVEGTANVLALAREAHADHGLSRFAHISTAYVAGKRVGDVPEEDLSDAHGFCSTYERTKLEAERLVRQALPSLPISIFRPGLVVGDSRTGAIKTFNTLYAPLRLYLTGKLRVIPADPGLRVNLVPVDTVADAVVRLTWDPRAAGRTFHLTLPYDRLPPLGELMAAVRDWAREHPGVRLPRPLFLPASLPPPGSLAVLAPYFRERRRFLRENTDAVLGPCELSWREMLGPLLECAAAHGFFHRSERTVHEQILFRLRSRSRPIRYHDIIEGRVLAHSGAEVGREARRAAAALAGMGVRPGDAVAVTGLNSARTLALDLAIGLAGAVGVPLYYTSPPAEIDRLLASSGARLLLIGAPAVIERVDELTSDIPVVSFCRRPPDRPARRPVLSWEAFLARGEGIEAPAAAPVGPDDPATVRYTSGTTGEPRGAGFSHAGLRWMAETVCALHPWRGRTSGVRTLSFLPMSHVVEGIIAAYSVAYAPSPVDVYFLEDFHDVPAALRRVRPTVFFSVPRVYEKMWEGFTASPLGRVYGRLPKGPWRQLAGRAAGRLLLRKAGLDRCEQLVVGSAPPGEALLAGLRELGIEVHNAYGLTEAPLITLNRVGANRPDTVGPPLPETVVRIADDGEVLVSGPQVASRIAGDAGASPVRDGWLATGDLGVLNADRSLSLQGRKKEMIATAYGKKIHPCRVEGMLREIPGVEQAVVVGEGRPYCVALLWVARADDASRLVEAVRSGVEAANARLSHPEQVKRWAILWNDLSMERGDLTPNLKLKRDEVARRRRQVVDALYEGNTPEARGLIGTGQAGDS